MITYRQQNSIVQTQNIAIENLSFENVGKFKYLGVTVTNRNNIRCIPLSHVGQLFVIFT